MTSSYDLEARRKRIETGAKIVGLCIAGFMFFPFALATIKGVVSLLTVVGIGLVTVNVGVPWFAVSLANWRLKALKATAAANPIETLENQYALRQEALLKIRDNITQSYSVLRTLYSQIKEHDQEYPDTPSQYTETYDKMKELIKMRGEKYKQAQANLAQFSKVIEEKRMEWKIAQTMGAASRLANVGNDFQSKLLNDTALTTIQDGLNLAFSDLETSLLDVSSTTVQVSPVPPGGVRQKTLTAPPSSLDLGFDADAVSVDPEPVEQPSVAKRRR